MPDAAALGGWTALVTKPLKGEDDEPFYAKLRAEAEQGLITNGEGTLYLRSSLISYDCVTGLHQPSVSWHAK